MINNNSNLNENNVENVTVEDVMVEDVTVENVMVENVNVDNVSTKKVKIQNKRKRRRRRKKKNMKSTTMNNEPQLTNSELSKLSDTGREELRKRLRNKIKNKRSGRVSKDEKNENLKNHVQMLKDKNIDINQYLTQMFPDHKQRKLNKKKIMKLLEE